MDEWGKGEHKVKADQGKDELEQETRGDGFTEPTQGKIVKWA